MEQKIYSFCVCFFIIIIFFSPVCMYVLPLFTVLFTTNTKRWCVLWCSCRPYFSVFFIINFSLYIYFSLHIRIVLLCYVFFFTFPSSYSSFPLWALSGSNIYVCGCRRGGGVATVMVRGILSRLFFCCVPFFGKKNKNLNHTNKSNKREHWIQSRAKKNSSFVLFLCCRCCFFLGFSSFPACFFCFVFSGSFFCSRSFDSCAFFPRFFLSDRCVLSYLMLVLLFFFFFFQFPYSDCVRIPASIEYNPLSIF